VPCNEGLEAAQVESPSRVKMVLEPYNEGLEAVK